MIRRSNGTLLPIILLALIGYPARSQTRSVAKPKLIVFITIDAMRADYLPRFEKQLTGGLGRLYKGGAVFTNAFQDHAITETAPGHSAMMSGRFPVHTGIMTNVAGVNDTTVSLVDALGLGASPFRFRGTTLTDWLIAKDPRTRALSVSRKDRGAILPIGRSKQQVFWYAANGDSLVQSVRSAFLQVPGVASAERISVLAQRDTVNDKIARRWLHIFPDEDQAALVVSLAPYNYWLAGYWQAQHGSPNDPDARVPIIFYGRDVRPGRYSEFARVVDMAPTLAAIVGVMPQEKLDGHVLQHAIR